MTILKTPIPKTILTSILSFIKSGYQARFNTNNTASGVYSATLNAANGTVTFSGTISDSPTSYTITNSFILPTTPLNIEVFCPNDGVVANVLCIFKGTGSVKIILGDGGTGTNGTPIIQFQILN
jgi:hypothetical protein